MKISKQSITVNDSPGFASSRLGIALGLEAIRMLASACDAFVVLLAPNGEHLALGLMAGAHATVTDEAAEGVLAAQIAAVHRIMGAGQRMRDVGQRVVAGPLVMDAREQLVWYAGKPLSLTRAEFSILLHLAQHKNRVCLTSQIVPVATGAAAGSRAANILKSRIHGIRKELRRVAPGDELIRAVPGIGYRLRADDD